MEEEKAGDGMPRSSEEVQEQERHSTMEEEAGNDMGSRSSRKEEQEPDSSTLKFSFTASKSKFSKAKFSASRPPLFPKGKQRMDEGEERRDVEFVAALNEHGIVAKDPKGLRGARVIPKLENSWRPEKRMKNIMMETDIMTSSTEERFEEETVVVGPDSSVQYGLSLGVRTVNATAVQQVVTTVVEEQNGNTMDEEKMGNGYKQPTSSLTLAQLEDERLRKDLTSLPDEADLDAYDEMPVEDFGEAILRGMGWEKGKPIGRNSKVAVVPVEYVKRSGRLGLGAEPAPKPVNITKHIKPGQSRVAAPELVASVGADGRVRNVVTLDEKLVERSRRGVMKGKVMSIISGRHLGLRGEVLDSEKPDRVSLKLVKSGEKVLVAAQDLADIGSLEEEKVLKQIRQLKIGNGEASRRDDRKEDYGNNHGTEETSPDKHDENKHGRKEDRRTEGRRQKDNRREERHEYVSKAEYRHEEEERSSRSSRRDGRRDERVDYEDQRRSSSRDGRRHHRKRDDYERGANDDDMEVEDEGRSKRSEDRRRGSVRGLNQQREERRDEGRRRESNRDGRREDERKQREQGKNLQERGERAGWDRRSIYNDGRLSDDRYDKERGEADVAGNPYRDSDVAPNEGRYKEAWLTSQIRVRIISKTLKGGKLYLKKARIVDVVTPKECDILLDESGEILQHVKQDQLETALPKRGGRVMAIGGKQRGLLGKLLDRNSEGEVGTVQMEESFEIITLDLDLLAEFVGDASERED